MKLGLTTKHYPNHGTVIVPCDSQGNALGDNVSSVEVKDGIVTIQYHADESMKFGGAKGMNSGHYRFSAMNDDSKGQDMANAEMKISVDTKEFQSMLDDFIKTTLPNAVRAIVQDEMNKQAKAAVMEIK
ncbi:hypothetical protein LVJ82_00645 [Vitreoscilla massiliensis]|uniref:Uncharacterized protein n=1 Tax=Vitreoscilla massiliensis TaxID=1689272 RepID=A0ABY4E5C0_9NEIS|nr:hypothetical protein [Vitreoscilla massiliensis]UOO89523.1 hypothetical protein LVJ82_00645 [Vitreoscilla massiliensis]